MKANPKFGTPGMGFKKTPEPKFFGKQTINTLLDHSASDQMQTPVDGSPCERWVDGRRVRGQYINGSCVLGI